VLIRSAWRLYVWDAGYRTSFGENFSALHFWLQSRLVGNDIQDIIFTCVSIDVHRQPIVTDPLHHTDRISPVFRLVPSRSGVVTMSVCPIKPLSLPWRNVTVSSDGLAITRGIEIGIGNPNQIFSFRPSTKSNNTRIFSKFNCGNETAGANFTACVGSNGGEFDSTKSSTFSVSIQDKWNGSLLDIGNQLAPASSYVYFNDEIDFDKKGSVLGYPIILDTMIGEG